MPIHHPSAGMLLIYSGPARCCFNFNAIIANALFCSAARVF
jgi:hypothetical protein